MNLEEKFWAKVERGTDVECWEWTGSRTLGYGTVSIEGRNKYSHRLSYELFVGPIPKGGVVHHRCANRGCVNPAHLEATTNIRNVMLGSSPHAQHARATYCVNGHPFDEENTRILGHRNGRDCRACNRERWHRTYARYKAEAAEKGVPVDWIVKGKA